uniref:Alternative protein UBE2Q2 n=1 Tax=Homo sapiens TaxID=9606 RepID=L8EC84_HUMAN|nr:alternative protein UBE2Q2 [Homo sapiens]
MQTLVLFERPLSPGPGCALLCSGKEHSTVVAAGILSIFFTDMVCGF